MMIRTLAIAWLTIREAIRSKLLLSLASLLVVGLVGLPFLISGDNTLSGQIQVILSYTTTFAAAILSVTTLWTACGGLSSEIQDRRLYLVITKPLHRYELWLGKWLGIMAVNAALLGLTGLIICAMAHHAIRSAEDSPKVKRQISEQFLNAHQGLQPLNPDWSPMAKEAAQRLIQSGRAPVAMTTEAIEQRIIEELKLSRFTVPPGGSVQFAYQRPDSLHKKEHDLILSYKFDSTRPERSPVAARWTLGTDTDSQIQINVTNYPGVPATVVISGDRIPATNLLAVMYERLDTNSQATLMLADRTQGPELLVPSGSFGMNVIRGLFVILCRLAFLAALGLTAGCLLSTPVAIFAACFILILLASAGYVESVATSGVFYIPHEGPAPVQTVVDRVILHLFRGFNLVTHPISQLDPIPLLAAGREVSLNMTLLALGWLVGLYSTITAIVGITLFNRRELG